MADHFLGESFWQGVLGNVLVNLLFSFGVGTLLATFLKYVVRVAWQRRQLIIGWASFGLAIFLTLQAIRYNTVSAKDSAIGSLQSSVETLNRRLAHWRISETQRKCLVLALTEMPPQSIRIYANIGDGESYGYAVSLVDPLTQSRWKVDFAGSMPYPMPGVWILLNSANGSPPVGAADLGKAFDKCGVPFVMRVESDLINAPGAWALVTGSKPD